MSDIKYSVITSDVIKSFDCIRYGVSCVHSTSQRLLLIVVHGLTMRICVRVSFIMFSNMFVAQIKKMIMVYGCFLGVSPLPMNCFYISEQNMYSCIEIYSSSCLHPLSNERKTMFKSGDSRAL